MCALTLTLCACVYIYIYIYIYIYVHIYIYIHTQHISFLKYLLVLPFLSNKSVDNNTGSLISIVLCHLFTLVVRVVCSGVGSLGSSHWELMGDAMITTDQVRLTPDKQSRQGAVWSRLVSILSRAMPVLSCLQSRRYRMRMRGRGRDPQY